MLTMASLAAAGGGIGRIIMALHGGERKPVALMIEAALGILLGIIVAAALLYVDRDMQGPGWPYMIVGGFAGCAGAMGTRMMDLVTDFLRKRLG